MVVPEGPLLEEAKDLQLPYFSIIDVPIKRQSYLKKKETKPSAYRDLVGFTHTKAQAMKHGCIDLFW